MELLAAGAAALGLPLTETQRARFERYRAALLAWNARVNLTAIVEPEAVERLHFLDSLTCTLPLLARWGTAAAIPSLRVIDVGSGAGFPGLPLKIALPQLRLTLLEATGKKAAFLTHVVAELGLTDVAVVAERAEVIGHHPAHREAYDVALARAVAALPALLELTLPFLRVGGVLIAPRKGELAAELAAAAPALAALGGAARPLVPITLPALADGRALVVVDKVAPTPAAYPRRPGVPAKRPLGVRSLGSAASTSPQLDAG
ncbi:MAG: 16S rRNA (guanine(527)-N(7))-methyltransferase RsmG [Chloroflexi bacterium]|nr:16S rRNA (guanine(527)-N(7))-methyltransferase RsmG [Chloroflexota bacterium]